jgi:hypothetical protein
MQDNAFQTLQLKNGLTLRVYDFSRKIAGDRWQVTVGAKIEIPVDHRTVDEKALGASIREVKNLIGEVQIFEQNLQRNFIDEGEKGEIVRELASSVIDGQGPYLSHEKFAAKFISRVYREAAKRQSWTFSSNSGNGEN